MFKYFLLISLGLFFVTVQASTKTIDKKINLNKNILKTKNLQEKITNLKIKSIALSIKKEEDIYDNIQHKISKVSNTILLNKVKLQKAKKDILEINKQTIKLKDDIKKEEKKLVDSISDKYSITLGQNLISKKSLDGMIQQETYNLILDNIKSNILKSNLNYLRLSNEKRKNGILKQKIEVFISKQESQKKNYKTLQKKQQFSLKNIKSKHIKYKSKLNYIIDKQNNINKLLTTLNIVKNKKIKEDNLTKLRLKKIKQRQAKLKKAKERKKRLANKKTNTKLKTKSKKVQDLIVVDAKEIRFTAKKEFQDNIDLKVRNIGSTSKGIKITSYRGRKTIAPLKKYTIVKKFGKYYDSVYKIELFNESISLKSKIPNAKVYSVLKGKVVYAKHNAGELGNVVIVKHNNNLHTIYSQLSDIPKTLKVGQWIPKKYVVGRVKSTLVFQATRNNRYLNPRKLFR